MRSELDAQCAALLERLARISPRPGGLGLLHWGTQRGLISERIRLDLALASSAADGVVHGLDLLLRAQALGSLGRSVDAPAATLEALRAELLGPDQGLLVYFPSLERSHLFVLDRSIVRHFELASRDVLVDRVRRFNTRIAEPPAANDPTRAADLSTLGLDLRRLLLPDPALVLLDGWSGVYVSGLDLLAHPAFELLPGRDAEPLGLRMAVSLVPSLPVALWLERRAKARSHIAFDGPERVVLAAPTLSTEIAKRWPNLPPIVLDEADVEVLGRGRADGKTAFHSGKDASLEQLLAVDPRSTLLELLTHGVHDFERDLPAGLALATLGEGDGVLWSEHIRGHLSSPPIVALYACGSALGPMRLGDDTAAQLGSAFLEKGADAVLLSRAQLDSKAMIALAGDFDAALSEPGVSPAEALRRARRRLATDSRWKDPFYFGLLSITGIGLRPPDRSLTAAQPEHETKREREGGHVVVSAFVVGALVILAGMWLARARRA